MKPLRIDHFLALKLPGHFEGFNWVSKGLQALSEESVRVHFLAQARGIWNTHLRQGMAKLPRRSLLQSIFLHSLAEYLADTFDKAVLGLFGGVC